MHKWVLVSHILRGCVRSRRVWKPNVQKATLYSNALKRNVQLKVTAYALR